jgi:hypothetical protein
VQAGRIKAQVRQAGRLGGRDRLGRLKHQRYRVRGVERAFGEHVEQRLADDPFHHHIGQLIGVFHVEHLGETRVI